jgi:hypothetical protein
MVTIRFVDGDAKRRALGWLTGRFGFKSWADGRMQLPAEALPHLLQERIAFEREEGEADEKQALEGGAADPCGFE